MQLINEKYTAYQLYNKVMILLLSVVCIYRDIQKDKIWCYFIESSYDGLPVRVGLTAGSPLTSKVKYCTWPQNLGEFRNGVCHSRYYVRFWTGNVRKFATIQSVGTDWRVILHFALKKQARGWVNMAQVTGSCEHWKSKYLYPQNLVFILTL
jgi:hypothetical protein